MEPWAGGPSWLSLDSGISSLGLAWTLDPADNIRGAYIRPEPVAEPTPQVLRQVPTLYPLTEIELLICRLSWPCEQALQVARCESGSDYIAGANSSGHICTYQISWHFHHKRFEAHGWGYEDAFVPERNIQVAHEIWLEQGWRPWSCRP